MRIHFTRDQGEDLELAEDARIIQLLETIMTGLTDLQAAAASLTAGLAKLTAAVDAATSGDSDAAVETVAQQLVAANAQVDALTAQLTPAPPPLTVSPESISSAVGAAVSVQLVPQDGTPPYSYVSDLADVTVDANGNVGGTPAAAETGTITVSDSATPPLTAQVAVTIS